MVNEHRFYIAKVNWNWSAYSILIQSNFACISGDTKLFQGIAETTALVTPGVITDEIHVGIIGRNPTIEEILAEFLNHFLEDLLEKSLEEFLT